MALPIIETLLQPWESNINKTKAMLHILASGKGLSPTPARRKPDDPEGLPI